MSDLRSVGIEAMADAWARLEEGEDYEMPGVAWANLRAVAAVQLDALLGVLEEHADGVGEALDYFDEMGGNTPYGAEIAFDCLNDTQQEAIIRAARLLAVLREDNG